MNPVSFTHYLDDISDADLIVTHDDISTDVNSLECGSLNKDDSVIYDDYLAFVLNGINTYKDSDEWVVLMINWCLLEDGSDICEEQSIYDPDGNVQIIAVNVGSDLVLSDDFFV